MTDDGISMNGGQQGGSFGTSQSGQGEGDRFGQSPREGYAAQGQQRQFDAGQRSPDFSGSGADGRLVEQIREHMAVLGQDGEQVGRVDSVDGERIKLTRADSGDGQHHYIAVSDVAGIENDQVLLHAGARPLPDNDGS